MARWNVEQTYPKLPSSDCWKDLPQIRHTKERDPKAKIAGARILDAYIAMADDKERDDAFGEILQKVHEAPSLEQPRTRMLCPSFLIRDSRAFCFAHANVHANVHAVSACMQTRISSAEVATQLAALEAPKSSAHTVT